jgi:hypothetical protein
VKKKTQSREPLKIPLDFKQTVLAALETPPGPRKRSAKSNKRKRGAPDK